MLQDQSKRPLAEPTSLNSGRGCPGNFDLLPYNSKTPKCTTPTPTGTGTGTGTGAGAGAGTSTLRVCSLDYLGQILLELNLTGIV